MKVLIAQGETLEISPADSDGTFTISYGDGHLKVEVDMPDTAGREGVIYDEHYLHADGFGSEDTAAEMMAPPIKFGGKHTGPVNCNRARGFLGEKGIDLPGRCERCGKTPDEIADGGCIFWTAEGWAIR